MRPAVPARRSEQRLEQSAHFGRIARHLEPAFFHDRELGVRRVGAAGVTAPPGKRMGHAGALISGGADTADAKLAIMEECGFKVTRNPSEMGRLLKALL